MDQPEVASPPGETLEEVLAERGMSQAELAGRTGRPRKTINEIIKGQAAITPETAIQLERVLGIPASFWNARQRQFEELRARADSQRRLRQSADWCKCFPVAQMTKLGWLPGSRSAVDRTEALLRFFRIGSPAEWDSVYARHGRATAFRESRSFTSEACALSAWIRRGEIEASELECVPFDRGRFRTSLKSVRSLIRDLPVGIEARLAETCAASGVAVVFVPLITGVHASGATRWLAADRCMLLLSLRRKREDAFWFSFFHEAGHLLLHGRRGFFVETGKRAGNAAEEDADDFARDCLIPPAAWKSFVGRGAFVGAAVADFAREVDASPGIVVGRLQHEGLISRAAMNDLRRTVDFKRTV